MRLCSWRLLGDFASHDEVADICELAGLLVGREQTGLISCAQNADALRQGVMMQRVTGVIVDRKDTVRARIDNKQV